MTPSRRLLLVAVLAWLVPAAGTVSAFGQTEREEVRAGLEKALRGRFGKQWAAENIPGIVQKAVDGLPNDGEIGEDDIDAAIDTVFSEVFGWSSVDDLLDQIRQERNLEASSSHTRLQTVSDEIRACLEEYLRKYFGRYWIAANIPNAVQKAVDGLPEDREIGEDDIRTAVETALADLFGLSSVEELLDSYRNVVGFSMEIEWIVEFCLCSRAAGQPVSPSLHTEPGSAPNEAAPKIQCPPPRRTRAVRRVPADNVPSWDTLNYKWVYQNPVIWRSLWGEPIKSQFELVFADPYGRMTIHCFEEWDNEFNVRLHFRYYHENTNLSPYTFRDPNLRVRHPEDRVHLQLGFWGAVEPTHSGESVSLQHTVLDFNSPQLDSAYEGVPYEEYFKHEVVFYGKGAEDLVRRIYHSEGFSFTDLRSGESNYIRTGDPARRTLDIILKTCSINLDEPPG